MSDHDLDRLDRRLRARGEQWRASLPALPEPDATGGRTRARGWYVAGVAAAVLLVTGGIGVGATLLDHGDRRSLPPSAPTASVPIASPVVSPVATPAGVVPWKALHATHPSLPATTIPASPDPALAAGVRACSANDLHESIGPGDGAGGTLYRRIVLRLAGSQPCRLAGYPTVEPLGHGQLLDLPVQRQSSPDGVFGTEAAVLLVPGRPAMITLAWAVSHSCPVVDNEALRITLPGLTAPFTVAGFGRSTCERGEGPATMAVGPVHPQQSTPARVVSPYDKVRASGDLTRSVAAGEPVDFTVTLTSTRDLPLAPCPDYSIMLDGQRTRYALDCAAVPHRDPQDRPYLPAGVPVTFAMRAGPITASPTKLLWQLETPTELVSLGGLLTVR